MKLFNCSMSDNAPTVDSYVDVGPSNPHQIRLSIALVTRNRPESLERTLQSLRAQSIQPWEVIVSDDSDEQNAAVVAMVAERYNAQYIRGPQCGLYANRNHIALACHGTHIRTMDDDHEFPDGHVAHCLDAISTDSDAVWVIGEYLHGQLPATTPPPIPGQLHPRGFSEPPTDYNHYWGISDGASIYPRHIFDRGIRYADDFKFGAAYLEFGSRLYWLGYRIKLLDSTFVIHHYDPASRSFLNQEIDVSSRFFAMLCHSFIYQPTTKNKLLCSLEIIRQVVLHGRIARPSLVNALQAFKKQARVCQRSSAYADYITRTTDHSGYRGIA